MITDTQLVKKPLHTPIRQTSHAPHGENEKKIGGSAELMHVFAR